MFGRALFLTIAAGALIGWLLPAGKSDTPPGEPTVTPPPAAAPAPPPRPTSSPTTREIVIARKPDGHFYADATVNGRSVRFLIDTGATAVALTSRDARQIGLPFSPSEFTVIGKGASGEVRGKPVTIDRIALGPIEAARIPGAIVAEGLDVSLLGQSFLSRVDSVRIAGDRMTLR
jgi:aspartyl protease family protein